MQNAARTTHAALCTLYYFNTQFLPSIITLYLIYGNMQRDMKSTILRTEP